LLRNTERDPSQFTYIVKETCGMSLLSISRDCLMLCKEKGSLRR
jgi:hypothetical protein